MKQEDIMGDLEEFCDAAIKFGAAEAKIVRAEDVVVRDWVRLKCQFGCGGYNNHLTCPPFSPTPDEMREVLGEYRWGILLRFTPPWEEKIRLTVAKLEREIFLSGYYKAFGLASGPCRLCDECNVEEGTCRKPDLARPSMEACGIDVYATARRAGFKIEVVRSRDQAPTYYGLVLVE